MESKLESGYASAASSTTSLPEITLTKAHIKHLNAQLENMSALDVLRFSKAFFPSLYQTTAFGLTGLVTLDMLSKLQAEAPDSHPVDLVFLDTLYHFEETLGLVDRVRQRYPSVKVHVYRPEGCDTVAEFESTHGGKLYETNSELYDWLAKVEPLQRAYSDLGVAAVLTGRRRSQGAARESIGVIEMDEERGIVKINPLVNWPFEKVQKYVEENQVPYNALLDRGYKSVGDWHSTSPVSEGEDERAGRWKGQTKTECGIHNKKSRYAQYLAELEAKEKESRLAAALEGVEKERLAEVDVQA
ncbi:putative phosphoadenosine phosphosulfate reductase protein [Zalerion maritima]|uniref:phosphoadenylyl-sulfate reductase (thioredoxin) n=1 Tax=Zalerion maritima TaxID=339359 RepID=A0AAD5RLH3_9PEZI|nr:putative phosphoadenosine phosphosulfate reductase protein [Zalerion maritima]